MRTAMGLSPPARGSQLHYKCTGMHWRSIPARAGEPWPRWESTGLSGVYPRPRGGASSCAARNCAPNGLSPPARGSLAGDFDRYQSPGSIPARAGEPPGFHVVRQVCEVYPRPRGGADHMLTYPPACSGLSPPARGSRAIKAPCVVWPRSIPARAGEPLPRGGCALHAWVYPRPRGGADGALACTSIQQGLSPPARGSRMHWWRLATYSRSIPARAGEPADGEPLVVTTRVYPRPRGGATCSVKVRRRTSGLSPPARGSRHSEANAATGHGSIPARAGEPTRLAGQQWQTGVYPRPRGGATVSSGRKVSGAGLSPPARGSQCHTESHLRPDGSIPARAGEPSLSG